MHPLKSTLCMDSVEMLTKTWVESYNISSDPTPQAVADYNEPCGLTAREIAIRTIILQGIVAVGAEVDPVPIKSWFRDQQIWDMVSPNEKVFLANSSPTDDERIKFRWHQEAEWALLWAIGKVEHLGLPTKCCDTARLVDEIIPALGSNIDDFLDSAQFRPPGVLLAEDDRTYNMWSYAQSSYRDGTLPKDLNWGVLYERRYAFEWLDGNQDWDEVTCDA